MWVLLRDKGDLLGFTPHSRNKTAKLSPVRESVKKSMTDFYLSIYLFIIIKTGKTRKYKRVQLFKI